MRVEFRLMGTAGVHGPRQSLKLEDGTSFEDVLAKGKEWAATQTQLRWSFMHVRLWDLMVKLNETETPKDSSETSEPTSEKSSDVSSSPSKESKSAPAVSNHSKSKR